MASIHSGNGNYKTAVSNYLEFVANSPAKTDPGMTLTTPNYALGSESGFTLTAHLPVGATGMVSFFYSTDNINFFNLATTSDPNSNVGSVYSITGQAVLVVPPGIMPDGSYYIKAHYEGNTAYLADDALLPQLLVLQTTVIGTTIDIGPYDQSGHTGDTITFSAKVTPSSVDTPAPTGTIHFTAVDTAHSLNRDFGTVPVDTAVQLDGSRIVYLRPLTVSATNGTNEIGFGTWVVKASYSGDSKYAATGETSTGYTAAAIAKTTTTITMSANQYTGIALTDYISISATLTTGATGIVFLYAQNTTGGAKFALEYAGTNLIDSVATVSANFAAGTYNITAHYDGDTGFTAADGVLVGQIVISEATSGGTPSLTSGSILSSVQNQVHVGPDYYDNYFDVWDSATEIQFEGVFDEWWIYGKDGAGATYSLPFMSGNDLATGVGSGPIIHTFCYFQGNGYGDNGSGSPMFYDIMPLYGPSVMIRLRKGITTQDFYIP